MKNKKTLVIAIVAVVLVVAVVLGVVLLGGNNTNGSTTTTTKPAGSTGTEKEYKLGMGAEVNFDTDKAQINATFATVVLDANGKIVSCRIDVAQNTVAFKDGKVDTTTVYETKMELGTRYGMGQDSITEANKWMDNNGDGKVYEWDVQTKAFENYVVGKTVAQIKAMTTQEVNGHHISTDNALLSAGCTIQIGDFKNAVVKACEDKHSMTFKTSETSFKLGIAANSYDDGSKDGTVNVYTDFAASVIGAGDKILASLNDAIQPTMTHDTAGKIKETSFNGTKRELESAYGMGQTSITEANGWMDNDKNGKVLEWYVQSEAFSSHVVGMTGSQVANMQTQIANGHEISADQDLLDAGCSIQITGIKAVVAKSATNAR